MAAAAMAAVSTGAMGTIAPHGGGNAPILAPPPLRAFEVRNNHKHDPT